MERVRVRPRVRSRYGLRSTAARNEPSIWNGTDWSQTHETADPSQLSALLTGPHRPFLVAAAGPGWTAGKLPDEVPLLTTLDEAIRLVSAAAAG